MRVLLVKLSSLGDVIHTLPALTDAVAAIPGIRFDWVVEEAFAEIPAWHPAVERVIPIALRRWRRHPGTALMSGEPRALLRALRQRRYDQVIDAQGLIKSGLVAAFAHGPRSGLDAGSAREPFASRFYHQRIAVPRGLHAIERLRRLFAAALGYECPATPLDAGIAESIETRSSSRPYLVFLHGTSWASKHWPEDYWRQLAELAARAGYAVKLPWGSDQEQARAERLSVLDGLEVLPRLGLRNLAETLKGARGVVGVDTGLVHLSAALGVPCVTVYGATDPGLTGTLGPGQAQLRAEFPCAPCLRRDCRYRGEAEVSPACYASVGPNKVWERLSGLLDSVGAGA